MTLFFSPFHRLYVAQRYTNGYLYTGRGNTFTEALINCLKAINTK